MPDGTKSLPEPMMTYHQSRGIHLRALLWDDLKIQIKIEIYPRTNLFKYLRWRLYCCNTFIDPLLKAPHCLLLSCGCMSLWFVCLDLCHHSLSGRTSYRKISWRLKAARLDAMLPRCLSNFRAIGEVQSWISPPCIIWWRILIHWVMVMKLESKCNDPLFRKATENVICKMQATLFAIQYTTIGKTACWGAYH